MKPSRDLYEVLGIKKTATAEQIRKAYRRMASKLHPDRNPGREEEAAAEFKELKDAYDVLSDSTKRRKYDATGEFDPKEPDNLMNDVLAVISNALAMATAEVVKNRTRLDIPRINMISRTREVIKKKLSEDRETAGHLREYIEMLRKNREQYKTKEPDAPNHLVDVCDTHISGAQKQLEETEHDIRMMERSFEVLDGFQFTNVAPAGIGGFLKIGSLEFKNFNFGS